jgi:predicted NBD/HSP70 family sugar kinase
MVRHVHEKQVLSILREHGGLSRAQLAARAGLSRSTLSEIAAGLLARGAIAVVSTDAGQRAGSGRPAELLELDPCSGQYMGVDIGHTRVRVAVTNAAHEIIAQGHVPYPAATAWPARLATAVELIDRLEDGSVATFQALQGIGVGVTGPQPATCARAAVVSAFAERFAAPVIVDNNTRFAALAEAIVDGPEARDLLYVRLSDGIGGGLVVGGRLVAGGHGVAGEFGHLPAERPGQICRCGKRGCLETVASVPAVLRACADRGLRLIDVQDLVLALAEGDAVAKAVVDDVSRAVGRALAGASLILDPVLIVIGGPLTRVVGCLVEKVSEIVAAEVVPVGGHVPVVRAARLGDDDGTRGAIAAVIRESSLLASYPGSAGSGA